MRSARFRAPALFVSLALGYSTLKVTVVHAEADAPITIHVAAPVGQATAYPQNGYCRIQLASSGLPNDQDLSLTLDDADAASAIPIINSEPSSKSPEDPRSLHGKLVNQNLTLWLPWPEYQGVVHAKLVSHGKTSNEVSFNLQTFFGLVPLPDFLVAAVSLVVAGLIFFIPIYIVKKWGGIEVPGSSGWLVSALFLDRETATYSLSKFQFYVWTAVSLIAYIYLAFARAVQQGYFNFVDIPENLPALIFISGATTATSQFVTVARGPKGAGPQNPSYADFVTSGGVVLAERFQFFVWTILGCIVFLFLVFSIPPSHIHELPKIPDGFLQLMGASALGYVGGKLARKPGPIIDEIVPTLSNDAPPVLVLTVSGRILSPDATFKLTYQTVDSADPKKLSTQEQQHDLTLDRADIKVVAADEQSRPDLTAKTLALTIRNHRPEWLTGKPALTISNPDGQSATWPFPGRPEIFDIKAAAGAQSLIVTLNGRNLPAASKFKIDDSGVDDTKLPLSNIEALEMDELWNPPRLAKSLRLTITNPDPAWLSGEHKLVLITPSGLMADATLKLAAA